MAPVSYLNVGNTCTLTVHKTRNFFKNPMLHIVRHSSVLSLR
jgi:hypothetical protein